MQRIQTIRKKQNKRAEYTAIYTVGSVGYTIVELLWRGFTHWTMSITGGICFLLFHLLNNGMKKAAVWKKCLAGSTVITAVEFLVGCIVNKGLHWNVWDYSDQRGNLRGQVCPLYFALWFLLCIPLIFLSRTLKRKYF